MEELVSVIVPVYNSEQYLSECVDSILNNTYRNLEVVLVDDGSPDRSGEICDDFACKDPRVIVIHQKNQGVAIARNIGLHHSSGTYVSFIDSDDMVSDSYFTEMVNILEKYDADMVGCEVTRKETDLLEKISNPRKIHIFCDYEEQLSLLVTSPAVRSLSWTGCYAANKVYRRSRISVEFNPKYIIGEDLRFNWDYIHNCRKIVTLGAAIYFYRPNPNSALQTYHSFLSNPKLGLANAKIWEDISIEPVKNQELDAFLKARAVYTAHGAMMRIFTNDHREYTETATHLRRLMKTNFKYFWNDKSSYSLPVRVAGLVCCYFFPVWRLMVFGCKYYSKWKTKN